ncbi:MAG TPA: thioredoxin family protein [Thermoanaerobaculia bacterium]|jgi:thiol:disulfide interchange protein
MDRTDAPAAAPPALAGPSQSQSRLSPVLLWVLIAAVLFRVVTAVMSRDRTEDTVGLVRWQPREKAPALAKSTGRPILYDFGAAWCGPCKLLDRDWADPVIAAKVNGGYVAARITDRQREDGRNPDDIADLMHKFEIVGFPALVVAAPDGHLLGKLEGYAGRERLMRFLENPATE